MGSPGEARRLFPKLEAMPDLTRGEERLAAEVARARERGEIIPHFAAEKAAYVWNIQAGSNEGEVE